MSVMLKLASSAAALAAASGFACAQLSGSANLVATNIGGGLTHYAATVHNGGSTTVGTFWYAWIPGVPPFDFMPHVPQNVTSPPGWVGIVRGGASANDGYSIEWYTISGNPIQPGNDLSGFSFDSQDPPSVMTANSPIYAHAYITSTSYLYIGFPETDPGYQFVATVSAGQSCYANCDGSSTAPVANVADFTCFLQKFAANDPYANCDASTSPPVINVADFTCFLQKFAAGCP